MKRARCVLIAQGDWGTQFGMLTQHMSELRPGGLAEVGQEDISDLLKLYKYGFLQKRKRILWSALLKPYHAHATPYLSCWHMPA